MYTVYLSCTNQIRENWLIECICFQQSSNITSLVPGHLWRGEETAEKNAWFQLFAHAQNFPRNLGNRVILVFFRVIATYSDEFSSALVLRKIYTDEGYSDSKPGRNDHVVIVFTFYSAMLHNDVLIKNNKYGWVIMQNNGAMKIP